VIELDLADGTDAAQVDDMCNRLLVNEVIESYTVDIL
jgi:phosphoribosylformylglycinamidine (FGAM) synthase PurS component